MVERRYNAAAWELSTFDNVQLLKEIHRSFKWDDCLLTILLIGRGESKPERRSGKKIIAGTAFRLEFLVGWYYDADATMEVPELY